MARPRKEVGDLRGDIDQAFLSLEAEVDQLVIDIANISFAQMVVTPVQTGPTYNANVGETVRCDSTGQAISVNLPAISPSNSGVSIEVKAVVGASPGSPLTNNITVLPNGTDLIDGAMSFVISKQRASYTFRSDGETGWMIV